MKLSEILTADHINISLRSRTKRGVIEELSQIAVLRSVVQTSDIVPLILAREAAASTGVGRGIAIPHCRLKDLEKPLLALGRTAEPIDWESVDNEPVDIFWFSVSPDNLHSIGLETLLSISKLMSNTDFAALLRQVKSPRQALDEIIRFGL